MERNGDGGEHCLVGDVGVDPETWKNAGFVGDVRVGVDNGRETFDAVLLRLQTTSFAVENDVN